MNTKLEKPTILEPFPALISAVRRILYPLVHLLMRAGIPFPQLAEILKEVYIEVADKQFRLVNKSQTQTRLSFLTGVHRKDVKRLQSSERDTEEPENISVGVKLVSQWIKEPRFLDETGKPLLLPLKSDHAPSFEELVRTICKQDIRSRVVLDEWLNLGIVKINDNHVELCSEAYIPRDSQKEKAYFLGHNVADHLTAASQNLFNESPEFFERCVYYDGLSGDSIAELQDMVEEQGMVFLKKRGTESTALYSHHGVTSLKVGNNYRVAIPVRLHAELPSWLASSNTTPTASTHYNYTHTGLYRFDIDINNQTFEQAPPLIVNSSSEQSYDDISNDRSVIINDDVFYLHNGNFWMQDWLGTTPAIGPK